MSGATTSGQVFPEPVFDTTGLGWQTPRMEDSPDRQAYAEQAVRAAQLMVTHLPANDPLRACLIAGVDPADSSWALLVDEHEDGSTTIRHPETGPTIRYTPLERLYQVPWDDPPRVVVAQLGDTEADTRYDAASVYISGQGVATVIDPEL
jgi:hypothetical protein